MRKGNIFGEIDIQQERITWLLETLDCYIGDLRLVGKEIVSVSQEKPSGVIVEALGNSILIKVQEIREGLEIISEEVCLREREVQKKTDPLTEKDTLIKQAA